MESSHLGNGEQRDPEAVDRAHVGKQLPGSVDAASAQAAPGASRRAGQRRVQRSDVRGPGDNRPAPPSIIQQLAEKAKQKRTTPPDDPEVAEHCPFFWELITNDNAGEGRTRFLPDLRLSRIDGGWVCTIQDVETGLSKAFSFIRLEDLARAAEYAVIDAEVPWKAFKNMKNPKGIDHHGKKSS